MLRVAAKNLQRLRCKIPPPWGRHYATESTTTNASTTTDDSTTADDPKNIIKSGFTDVDLPSMTVSHFVWELIDRWPDRTAMVCGITGRSYTYAQLRERSRKFATSLQRMKIEPGSKLSLILPNCPDYPAVVLGAMEAGLVVNMFNTTYIPAEIVGLIKEMNPRVIVTFPEKYQQILEAANLAATSGYQPPVYVIVQGLERSDVPAGTVDGKEMMEKNMDAVPLAGHKASPDSTICLPYSSGTSGLPKGVMLSHRNIVACGNQMNNEPKISIAEYTTNTYQDVMMAVLPFFHIYGLAIILFSKLRCGAMIVTVPRFEAKSFIHVMEHYKVTKACLVPPLVKFMAVFPGVKPEALPELKLTVCGAAPLPVSDLTLFMEKFQKVNIIQGYGMTETVAAITVTDKSNPIKTTVGQIVPNTQIKIADLRTGRAMKAGGIGEICIRGPQVMLGYYENQQATDDMIDKWEWLHTGDIGYYDKEHNIFIVDRLKELIKVKGEQVAPAELEAIIRTHPDVADAAVIGIKDERTGEAPLAYLVLKPGVTNKHVEQSVKDHVASRVSSFKYIKAVRVVEFIPRSPTGKTFYKDLREWYKQE